MIKKFLKNGGGEGSGGVGGGANLRFEWIAQGKLGSHLADDFLLFGERGIMEWSLRVFYFDSHIACVVEWSSCSVSPAVRTRSRSLPMPHKHAHIN